MGCSPSKIRTISITHDNIDGDNGDLKPSSGSHLSRSDEEATLPNRLLSAAIPVSDLGDSLDSRHLGESLNLSHHSARLKNGDLKGSADSGGGDSVDSGYDEYVMPLSIRFTSSTLLVSKLILTALKASFYTFRKHCDYFSIL